MGNTKHPRKKYKPRAVLRNPVGYVLESLSPLREHDFSLLDLRIKHSEAMLALTRGTATKTHIDRLVGMNNITEALWQMGFGTEYRNVAVAGREALLNIVQRATKHGRFTPTGPEIQALNMLMELHDAQMDVITVKDLELAYDHVRRQMSTAIKLPAVPDNLKSEHS